MPWWLVNVLGHRLYMMCRLLKSKLKKPLWVHSIHTLHITCYHKLTITTSLLMFTIEKTKSFFPLFLPLHTWGGMRLVHVVGDFCPYLEPAQFYYMKMDFFWRAPQKNHWPYIFLKTIVAQKSTIHHLKAPNRVTLVLHYPEMFAVSDIRVYDQTPQ